MRNRARFFVTALAAAAILAAAVGTASANRFSTSSQSFKAVWTPLAFSGGGITIKCNVTLEGTFHAGTIVKSSLALVGFVTRARTTRPCTGGTAWIYNGSETNEVLRGTLESSLPWHILYKEFRGTLPNAITEIRILLRNARFLLRATILGIPALCTYNTGNTGADGLILLGRGGTVSGLRAEPSPAIALERGEFGCPNEGSFEGTGSVTNGSGANVTVTLI